MPAAARQLRLLPAAPVRLHGWLLPWGGRPPAVFHRVRSLCHRAAIKNAGRAFGIRINCTTMRYTTQSLSAGAIPIVNREEWLRLENRAALISLPHECRLVAISVGLLIGLVFARRQMRRVDGGAHSRTARSVVCPPKIPTQRR